MTEQCKSEKLKIAAWNAADVSNKILELKLFLESHSSDIVLHSETWMKPPDNLSIENFLCYKTNRLTGRGVVLPFS